MAYSILEQIAQNVVTTLSAVTVAGGYANTLTVVRRTGPELPIMADRLVVVSQDDPELVEMAETPIGCIAWKQPFWLDCYILISESDNKPIDAEINSARADIEKAIMADRHRNNLAVDTLLAPPQYFQTKHGHAEGLRSRIDVIYRTRENDPYTQ